MSWLRRLAWWRRSCDPSEASIAAAQSRQTLREVRARWDEVNDVTARLRALRQRNHFAEMIERAMRGDE